MEKNNMSESAVVRMVQYSFTASSAEALGQLLAFHDDIRLKKECLVALDEESEATEYIKHVSLPTLNPRKNPVIGSFIAEVYSSTTDTLKIWKDFCKEAMPLVDVSYISCSKKDGAFVADACGSFAKK